MLRGLASAVCKVTLRSRLRKVRNRQPSRLCGEFPPRMPPVSWDSCSIMRNMTSIDAGAGPRKHIARAWHAVFASRLTMRVFADASVVVCFHVLAAIVMAFHTQFTRGAACPLGA